MELLTLSIKNNIRNNDEMLDRLEIKEKVLLDKLTEVKKEYNFHKSQNSLLNKLLNDKDIIKLKQISDKIYFDENKEFCYFKINDETVITTTEVKYKIIKNINEYLFVKKEKGEK